MCMIVYDYPIVYKVLKNDRGWCNMKSYKEMSKEELLTLKAELEKAVAAYQKRNRRFGGLTEE